MPPEMSTHYFIDDVVLGKALKEETAHTIWKTTYQHFREPFIFYFRDQHGLTKKERQELYQRAFATLIQGLREELIFSSAEQTLFRDLLQIGVKTSRINSPDIKVSGEIKDEYFAGEVLILLMQSGCQAIFPLLIKYYKNMIGTIFKSKYPHIETSFMEAFGEAIMILKYKIENQELEIPMRARLFTFFYRITLNKYRQAIKKQKSKTLPFGEKELEDLSNKIVLEKECNRNDYLDNLTDRWPILFGMLKDSSKAFDELIKELSIKEQQLLKMRFEDNMRHKEIATHFNIKENNCRRKYFNTLRKWKKIFFLNHVIKPTKGNCREYLILYLIKDKSFEEIANHMEIQEDIVKTAIENYLNKWRNKNR